MKIKLIEENKRKPIYDIFRIFLEPNEIEFVSFKENILIEKEYVKTSNIVKYHDLISLKKVLYHFLEQETKKSSPWGICTGTKPSKLLKKFTEEQLKEIFLISNEKIALLNTIKDVQRSFISDNNRINLYINIPFCPSRCAYCSFPTIVKRDRVKRYMQCLVHEIKKMGKIITAPVRTIYFGGGTPTVLESYQMEVIFEAIREAFDLSTIEEITVEAGREDTLEDEKLDTLKKLGVTRISLNPQTFNDQILQKVARKQDNKRLIELFTYARSKGFIINMDFILGLESEDQKSVRNNLDWVHKLQPENVTVHTLSIKKGSKYEEKLFRSASKAGKMFSMMYEYLLANDWKPYYLYRQKQITENLENIGYAKPGTESMYNIIINEEVETIIGMGMAANSKFISKESIQYTNPKNIRQYMEEIEKIVEEKRKIYEKIYISS